MVATRIPGVTFMPSDADEGSNASPMDDVEVRRESLILTYDKN